jgi:pectin methylesterase-like acyl-CoA thioesterase
MVGLGVELSDAQIHRRYGSRLLPYRKITVDPKGHHGSFSTIQSAIDSIPSKNRYWTSIIIKEGIYR